MPLLNDKRPLYLRIKGYLEHQIENEIYLPGDKLPSETALAEELEVSRATLREALRVLEEEGKIIKHQGIGTFVSEPKPRFKRGIEELVSVTETIEKEGFKPGTKDLRVEKFIPSQSVRKKMALQQSTEVIRLERIRTADELPVIYCLDYLNTEYLNTGLSENDFSGSLFQTLQNEYHILIDYAVTQIAPVKAEEHMAKLLEIRPGTPLLLLEQYHYDQQENMILFSQNYFRSDQFQFKVLRKR